MVPFCHFGLISSTPVNATLVNGNSGTDGSNLGYFSDSTNTNPISNGEKLYIAISSMLNYFATPIVAKLGLFGNVAILSSVEC